MKKIRKEIAEFYKKIFSNAVLKNRIQEKARKIVTEADLRKLIREDIMPLMKKEKLNCSEEELIEYEEETLKKLSKEALAGVSGGVSVKSALWAGGILSMALFGSLNAHAMDVDPPALPEQKQIIQTRSSDQQQNNSGNTNNNANQPGNNGNNNNNDNDNNAANNNDRARAWRDTLYGLSNKLPPSFQKWAASLIEKGLIVSDGNYLFFRHKSGSVSPLLPFDVTVLILPPMGWDVNGNVYHVNRISRFYGPGVGNLAKVTKFIIDPSVKNLTIASRCFANNKILESVDLQSVENLTIEEGAFEGCEKLSKFITSPKLKSLTIPRRCFANNTMLESVDLQSVENLTIEEGAFEGCEKLVEFILAENPKNISIKENAFAGCSSLAKFILSEDPKNIFIRENAFVRCNSLDKELLKNKYDYVESPANNDNNNNNSNKPGDDIAPSANISDDNNNNNANEVPHPQHSSSGSNAPANINNDNNNNNNAANEVSQHQDSNSGDNAPANIKFRTILVPTANTCSPNDYEEIKIPALDDYEEIKPPALNNYKEIKIQPTKKYLDKIISRWEATLSEEIKGNAYFKGIKNLILNVYETYLGTDEAEGMLTDLKEVLLGNQKNISIGADESFSTLYIFNKKTGKATPILSLGITKLVISSPTVGIEGNAHDITLNNNILGYYWDGPGKLKNLKELVVKNVPNFTFGKSCFNYSKNLEKVDISDVVNLTIESYAFTDCQKLYEVDVINLSIDDSAFNDCSKLKEVKWPQKADDILIGTGAFNKCNSLQIPILSAKNITLEDGAFANYLNLKEITFVGDSISIGSNVFSNCTNIKKVNFSCNSISTGNFTFYNCTSLEQIRFTKEPASLHIKGPAFFGCKNFKDPEFKKICDIHKVPGSAFWGSVFDENANNQNVPVDDDDNDSLNTDNQNVPVDGYYNNFMFPDPIPRYIVTTTITIGLLY